MKLRKRSRRGDRYESLAEGYKALKSPLSAAYASAAEHYHEADPPDGLANDSNGHRGSLNEGDATERP